MLRKWLIAPLLAVLAIPALLLAVPAVAVADYKVEKIDAKPSEAEVGKDVADRLVTPGFKIVGDDKNTVCEIWTAKEWTIQPGFTPSNNIIYPFVPGSLIGALKFPKKGADFRGQDIPAGVYTLRFALQPETGTHVGTFDTRDFLVMLSGKTDNSLAPITNEEQLANESSKSADSTHPGIMALVKHTGGTSGALHHMEEKEWWTLELVGKDAEGKQYPLEVIVVGKTAE